MPLQDSDIPNIKLQRLSRFVTNQLGIWFFDSPANHDQPTKIGNSRCYKIPLEFGITRATANSPDNPVAKGNAGDYAILHPTGEYSIISAEDFKILNSTKKST